LRPFDGSSRNGSCRDGSRHEGSCREGSWGDSCSPKPEPAGSNAALVQEAYDRWSADIHRFLQGCLANHGLAHRGAAGDAEELLQRTFQRLLESGHDVAPGAVRSWLFRVAYNEVMLAGRRRGVEQRGFERLTHAEPLQSRASAADPPWVAVVRGEDVERVRTALRELPPEQRQVVEDRIFDGRTFAEIASLRGLPLGTVLTRMRLALTKLERSLQERQTRVEPEA